MLLSSLLYISLAICVISHVRGAPTDRGEEAFGKVASRKPLLVPAAGSLPTSAAASLSGNSQSAERNSAGGSPRRRSSSSGNDSNFPVTGDLSLLTGIPAQDSFGTTPGPPSQGRPVDLPPKTDTNAPGKDGVTQSRWSDTTSSTQSQRVVSSGVPLSQYSPSNNAQSAQNQSPGSRRSSTSSSEQTLSDKSSGIRVDLTNFDPSFLSTRKSDTAEDSLKTPRTLGPGGAIKPGAVPNLDKPLPPHPSQDAIDSIIATLPETTTESDKQSLKRFNDWVSTLGELEIPSTAIVANVAAFALHPGNKVITYLASLSQCVPQKSNHRPPTIKQLEAISLNTQPGRTIARDLGVYLGKRYKEIGNEIENQLNKRQAVLRKQIIPLGGKGNKWVELNHWLTIDIRPVLDDVISNAEIKTLRGEVQKIVSVLKQNTQVSEKGYQIVPGTQF